MFFVQEVIKNTVCYSDFLLKHHQNLGFQLFLDQFCEDHGLNHHQNLSFQLLLNQLCEDQAYHRETQKHTKKKTAFETRWW